MDKLGYITSTLKNMVRVPLLVIQDMLNQSGQIVDILKMYHNIVLSLIHILQFI